LVDKLDWELDRVPVEPTWTLVVLIVAVDCDVAVPDVTVPVVGCVGAAAPAT
jgi:hypothetical protein